MKILRQKSFSKQNIDLLKKNAEDLINSVRKNKSKIKKRYTKDLSAISSGTQKKIEVKADKTGPIIDFD